MKIVLTGAGGGHFYPLIAVAERIERETQKEQIIDSEIFFFSDKEYNSSLLDSKNIKYVHIPAGKMRLYFSLENILDPIKSFFGFFVALYKLFSIYPDVVFAKGGYSSLPVIFAAKILSIPIFIHESDSAPGKTNLIAGKIAKRVAVSYLDAGKYFDIKKTAYTGQPVMQGYLPSKEKLEKKINNPTSSNGRKNIFILGGSQGSETINNMILEALPDLVERYNIIHQVGENNFNKVKISSEIILKDNPNKENYHYFAFDDLSKYYEVADICVTRAGSSLFEMSAWGIPTIIIPITLSNNNHQMLNAYTFEKAGCSIVIEEANFKKGIFLNAIDSILENKDRYEKMRFNNLNNFKSGAAELIAKEIIKIGLSHNY